MELHTSLEVPKILICLPSLTSAFDCNVPDLLDWDALCPDDCEQHNTDDSIASSHEVQKPFPLILRSRPLDLEDERNDSKLAEVDRCHIETEGDPIVKLILRNLERFQVFDVPTQSPMDR